MPDKSCDHCPMRKKFDQNPKSLMGRFWRWHINWCPGWKKYLAGLDDMERVKVCEKYDMKW